MTLVPSGDGCKGRPETQCLVIVAPAAVGLILLLGVGVGVLLERSSEGPSIGERPGACGVELFLG